MDNLTEYLNSKESFNSTLAIGDTGVGKSSQIALFVKYLFDNFGYKALLLLADQGSGPAPYIDLGLIENCGMKMFSLHDTNHPVKFMSNISQGFWPEYEEDSENSIKPKIRTTNNYKIDFNEYQIIILDSLTGLSEYLGEYFSTPTNNIGFKLATNARDDDYEYGTMAQGHYQLVHKEITKFFQIIPRLPIKYLFVTAQIEDTPRGYFPATVGKALNTKIGGWFRNSFHLSLETVPVRTIKKQKLTSEFSIDGMEDEDLLEVRVAHYVEHKNNLTGKPYKIKARVPLPIVKLVEARYPEGFQVLDTKIGLARFFEFLEVAKKAVEKKEKG